MKTKGNSTWCSESVKYVGVISGLHSLSTSLKGRSTSLTACHPAMMATPRESEEERKFMKRVLLGWPKGTCHRGAKKGIEKSAHLPQN